MSADPTGKMTRVSEQPEPDIAVRGNARLGQEPTWDPASDTLLWVDVLAGVVHRYVPGGEDHVLEVPQQVSAAKPRSLGGLVLHLTEGVALFEANGQQRTWLVYWARDGFRAGAATVDSHGRLWAATVPGDGSERGWLARVGADGGVSLALDDVAAPAGLTFSPDGMRLYLADSSARRIDVLDVDPATGRTSDRRPLCEVDETAGHPAGLCADVDGCVWVAVHDGGELRRYTPEGELDRSVGLPVASPTGCCFGGPDLTDLYVTSARSERADDVDGSLLVLPGAGEGLRMPFFAA